MEWEHFITYAQRARFPKGKGNWLLWILLSAVGVCILGLLFYFVSFRPPSQFPQTAVVTVNGGTNINQVAATLKQNHIIRSTFWFTNFVILLNRHKGAVGGTYYFEQPLNVFQVARRIVTGNFNMAQLKTTIPEGSTIFDISQIIKKRYQSFDDIHFLTIAKGKEGYLFPDTYLFGPNPVPEKVLDMMMTNFNKKISDPNVASAIQNFGKPLNDVITMASLLEGEARQTETRKIVAGILWKRIDLGMPLQVDSAFRYVNGKTTDQLTAQDLKIDSPYNTYLYPGLPPTPISNPGLDTITAAVTPTKTKYLYFLTDKDGTMHYAETLDEHAANKSKYLK